MDEGYLITLEGLDGTGTTTVSEALVAHFDDAVFTSEPTDMWTGKTVRRCISSDSNTHALTDFYFFMGDRVEHVNKIISPNVDDGKIVISDRYADSTRAYQGVSLASGGMDEEYVDRYIETVMSAFSYVPDLTLWLDTPIDTSFDRVDGDEKYEETMSFQENVRRRYSTMHETEDRIIRVDADRPIEDVVDACIAEVEHIVNTV